MFFEEYINFKFFPYLTHCGVIQYIRSQPSGLGLSGDQSVSNYLRGRSVLLCTCT
jgi:hypothetical protein